MWIASSIIFLTFLFLILDNEGICKLNRIRPGAEAKNQPPISIIIPAYRSEHTIEKTLRSIRSLDYPKKEIIVVNDSDDKTPAICRKYGVKLIQNKKRMGKSVSLDIATKKARNEILLFVDSDTVVERDLAKKIVPWFYRPKVAVVMPTFAADNKKGIARMVSIDNVFTHFHLRIHLHFGTLVSFRGCCFAIRKTVIEDLGGWGNFLTEDNEMGARISEKGLEIQWEPLAVARTNEPETKEELKRQKMRWAAGSAYTFFRHRRYYMTSPQFLLSIFAYMLITIAASLMILWSIYLFATTLSPAPVIYMMTELVAIMIATYVHVTVIIFREGGIMNPLLIMKYLFYYVPMLNLFYSKGFMKGLKAKRVKRHEMDLGLW
jgi:cellulose synthase/poly-beta-1,6-N-acetylglucosamine synthase-like glycosyltransferase